MILQENAYIIIIGIISYLYTQILYEYIISLIGTSIYNYIMIYIFSLYFFNNYKTISMGGEIIKIMIK